MILEEEISNHLNIINAQMAQLDAYENGSREAAANVAIMMRQYSEIGPLLRQLRDIKTGAE